ncbi:MAG: OB-fold nucleic acid binding domain-containing protein [Candidatus Altiarchaeota archaeon]|nr:OB-fold nucleic acid binding domain-containing protein [Candidatus Altiarchaeota archaeon]
MNDIQGLIDKVSRESKLTEADIKAKMSERKEKTHGLLSDYGALYAVAKEYGVDLSEGEAQTQVSDISSIKPQGSVNVCGRVRIVYSPREFKRKDNTAGKFASVEIADKTGGIRVVLWNGNAEITKQLHVGDVMYVKNGFSKDNRGAIEIHAGNLTSVAINPKTLPVELPTMAEEKTNTIASLKSDMDSATIRCRVNAYYPPTEFKRSDGTTGKRASFIAQDESGTIRVVLWGDNAGVSLKEGDIIKIENAYTRTGLNSEVEVQVGSRSRVIPLDEKLQLPPIEKKAQAPPGELSIADIKPDLRGFNASGRIVKIYPPRDYANGKMSSLVLADKTGSMRVVLWNEKSAVAGELKEGDAIKITNAYSKANLSNEPEIHVGKYGDVIVTPNLNVPSMDELGKFAGTDKKIADLENNERNVRITGRIVDMNAERPVLYATCPSCSKKAQNLGGDFLCDSCGSIDPNYNMVLSFTIEDDSGNIRSVVFKENAEKLAGFDAEEAMNMMGESQDELAPARRIRELLLNKQFSLTGRVRYNEYGDQLEFMVDSIG